MCTAERGVTLVELLITLAIVSMILTGAYTTFLGSSKRLVLQNETVEMQTEARAAMDLMVRELRLAYGVDGANTRAGSSSGSNTTTTLNDTTQTWATNAFVPSYAVRITTGTGKGQARLISSNTSTQLTVSSPWTTVPDSSSGYIIVQEPTISTNVTTNDTVTFDRLESSGYSSGSNTTTTLNDTNQTWPTFSDPSSYTVRIISGRGAGQTRSLSSNTSTQLTVSSPWTTTPDTSAFYVLTLPRAFTRTSPSDNVLRYTVGSSVNQPLADLIVSHAFSRDLSTPDSISITLTAQARNAIDPHTGEKRLYTLTETVLNRN